MVEVVRAWVRNPEKNPQQFKLAVYDLLKANNDNLINGGLSGDTVAIIYLGHGDADLMGLDPDTWKSLIGRLQAPPKAIVASAGRLSR